MKIWIHVGDEQKGPYTLEELREMLITPDTPVWYAGLTQWLEAGEAPLTAVLFEKPQEESLGEEPQQPLDESQSEPQLAAAVSQDVAPEPEQRADVDIAPHAQIPTPPKPFATQPQWQPAWQQYQQPQTPMEKCPPNFLWLSILLTVLCCNPFSIIAIIMSFKVNSRYMNGDIEGSRKASEQVQWWIAISIVLMLLFCPVSMLISL